MHVEWGAHAAQQLGPDNDVAVVVDVLSFTTTLTVALDRGWQVLPHRWGTHDAEAFAESQDATLAVGRLNAEAGQVSLSPQTVRAAGPGIERLVLPSPNGATIAAVLGEGLPADTPHGDVLKTRFGNAPFSMSPNAAAMGEGGYPSVMAASLRNAEAVATWLTTRYRPDGARLLVLAAGEQWPGGQLRPAVEDLWGAGAVVSGLRQRGWLRLSVEAAVAAEAYEAVSGDMRGLLRESTSGQVLAAMGFTDDIDIAAEVDQSTVVPELVLGVFYDAQ